MSILSEILATKRSEVDCAASRTPLIELKQRVKDLPPTRDFAAALRHGRAHDGMALIAEAKKASPSKGVFREDYDPVALACSYQAGGASCISVLTDTEYFQGSANDLRAVRQAVEVPVLRKDFTIDEYQIWDARRLGADAILLIVAALTLPRLIEFTELAGSLGLASLIEVHNQEELELALKTSSPLIGVNNRDLHTFRTTIETTLGLAPFVPEDRLLVSESGISTRKDVLRLMACGAGAILAGESLVRQQDIEGTIRELLGR